MTDQRPSLKLRLLLWLYSNANILGCLLGLIGPALLFAGLIGSGWGYITAGLYATGWVIGWAWLGSPAVERRIEASLDARQVLERLDELLAKTRAHLTAEMNQHLDSLRGSIADILQRTAQGPDGGGHDANLYTVRETVLRYLPETLANYLSLPPAFRATHTLKDGRTSRQLLTEQLSLLDDKMREIVANIAQSDAQALLANGRFLEAKFRQPDFLL